MGRAVPSAATECSAGADCAKSTVELLKQCRGLCSRGHKLESRISRAGHCDGCGVMVMSGELVMDCRACNWYLCGTCHPQIREGASVWDQLASFAGAAAQEVAEVSQWTDSFSIGLSSFLPGPSCAAPPGSDFEFDEEIIDSSAVFEAREPLLVQPQHRRNQCAEDSPSDSDDESRPLHPQRGVGCIEEDAGLPKEVTRPHDVIGMESDEAIEEVTPDLRPAQAQALPAQQDLLDLSSESEDTAPDKMLDIASAAHRDPTPSKVAKDRSPLLQFDPEKKGHGISKSLIQLEEWDVPAATAAAGA